MPTLKLIKEDTNCVKCAKEIKKILEDNNFLTSEGKGSAGNYQFRISENNKQQGVLRFYQKRDGSTVIDNSQIISSNTKDKIKILLDGYLNLEAFEEGKIPLGSRNISEDLIPIIKNKLIENFPELKDTKVSDQVFEYKFVGNNLIISQYKVGSILFQGKCTKFSDKIISLVDKIIAENQKDFLLSKIKEQVPKEEYIIIKKALQEKKINVGDHINTKVYSLISGCGTYLLQDGLTIFYTIKEKDIKLKDYGSLLRNFGMLLEDFLTNWLIKLKLINEGDLKIDPRELYIGKILKSPSKIEEKYKKCYIRQRPKFIEKLQTTYQECRHDILHADKFKYKPIVSLSEAELKLKNIIDCMDDCANLFSEYLNLNNGEILKSGSEILGTDEAGKGDYFGPLVVAGVFIGDPDIEMKLRNIGVKDSKTISDIKIKKLAEEIRKLCKYNIVIISPERYNQLYGDIKNLNTLLGWGHARVIENMLKITKPQYVISDKFGDESFIKSKLMEKGKKINLVQEINAEQNIAVAAASILARDSFLNSMQKLSKQYKFFLPKGSGEETINAGKDIVKNKGEGVLKQIAKMHFSITDKIT
jgi:ribonuclease HIII